MTSSLIFYDIPSKNQAGCWSPNTWKTRLVLNFKIVEYNTHWIEYPDIKATISPHVSPNVANGVRPYTLPVVQLPDNSWMMNSQKIVERLEKDYPSPSLRFDDPLFPDVERNLMKCKAALTGVCIPRVPETLLNSSSKDFFHETREKAVGKPLPQVEKEQGGEEAWMEALPALKELGLILEKNSGPFVLGKNVSYADFVVVGYLHFVKLINEDIFQKIVAIEPSLKILYNASKKWLERDSH